jgi:hypothetical protein
MLVALGRSGVPFPSGKEERVRDGFGWIEDKVYVEGFIEKSSRWDVDKSLKSRQLRSEKNQDILQLDCGKREMPLCGSLRLSESWRLRK